jgi:hypothetical protein
MRVGVRPHANALLLYLFFSRGESSLPPPSPVQTTREKTFHDIFSPCKHNSTDQNRSVQTHRHTERWATFSASGWGAIEAIFISQHAPTQHMIQIPIAPHLNGSTRDARSLPPCMMPRGALVSRASIGREAAGRRRASLHGWLACGGRRAVVLVVGISCGRATPRRGDQADPGSLGARDAPAPVPSPG